nr:MAG TPA: hypothetical protein [Caudoviricetes sp.]
MEYRQNSIEPYTGDDSDTEDIPDEESHGGNTGLPFGLCICLKHTKSMKRYIRH